MVPGGGNSKRIGRYRIMECKRKSLPAGQSILNTNEGESFESDSNGVKIGSTLELPAHMIGEDGYYYECVICNDCGDLLCCDTCPRTYHLQCLSPPLEQVPPGDWQCPNCSKEIDLSTPIRHLKSSKKNVSSSKMDSFSKKNLDLSLDTHADLQSSSHGDDDTADHIEDGKGVESSNKVTDTKVYKRRICSKIVEGEDINYRAAGRVNEAKDSIVETLRLLNRPSIRTLFPEQAERELENANFKSVRHQKSVESCENPVEEQGEARSRDSINQNNSTRSPKKNEQDKLLILRDVLQESMESHLKRRQSENEDRDAHQEQDPKHTEAGQSLNEKFARLRARQKKRLASRNTSRGAFPISGIVGSEPLLQFQTARFGGTSQMHASANDLKGCTLNKPLRITNQVSGVDQWQDRSLNRGYNHTNRSVDHSQRSHLKGPYNRQSKWASDAGCFTSLTLKNKEIASSEEPFYFLKSSTSCQGTHYHPWKSSARSLTSNLSFSRSFDSVPMRISSNNSRIIDYWFEEELDSLWMGVRRYGQDNWNAMLSDPTLRFSKHKTAEDLSERWKKERCKILYTGKFSDSKSTCLPSGTSEGSTSWISRGNRSIDVNSEQLLPQICQSYLTKPIFSSASSKDQLALGETKKPSQELLLGGSFQLPPVTVDWSGSDYFGETVSKLSKRKRVEEKELSSEGTISD